MSLLRKPLNLFLRLTERPLLARIQEPQEARTSFERKARFWFHAPRGTKFAQDDLGGRPALWVNRGQGAGAILYFHGGGYFFGSPRTHRAMLAKLSKLTGVPACLPDYRLAPEHPFPAAFEDALAAYRALLESGVPAAQVVLGGDSAGGGLVLSLLAAICDEGLPCPAMTFAFSPWADLSRTGASLLENEPTEVVLPPERTEEVRDTYLQGADPKDPRASPVFAAFKGATQVVLFASTSEILRDDTREMVNVLRHQGVSVAVTYEKGLPHVWPIFEGFLPEANATLRALAGHINARLG